MAYTLLAIDPNKRTLDDIEYLTNKIRDDINVIKSRTLHEGFNILNKEPIDVLVVNTTFEGEKDGYKAVLDLRRTFHKFLPIIFFSDIKELAFCLTVFKETNCIDFLTSPLNPAKYEEALAVALNWAERLKQDFFTIVQGKSFVPISGSTFLYAEIRKNEDKIDVYEYDSFTGKKSGICLTNMTVTKFLKAVKYTKFIAECYRGVVVNKKMIVGYDGENLILKGDNLVPLGGKFKDDLIDYIKKI